MRFAMAELKLALATIARHVEFDRVSDSLEPSVGITFDSRTARSSRPNVS